jgi:chromosome segregation ATPase
MGNFREIIKGKNDLEHTLFIAIDYSNVAPFTHHNVFIFNGRKTNDKLNFSKFIDTLFNDWTLGIDVEFNQPHESLIWNINETAPFSPYVAKEKVDYLVLKAKRNTVAFLSGNYRDIVLKHINEISKTILEAKENNPEHGDKINEAEEAIKKGLNNGKANRTDGSLHAEILLTNDANACKDALQPLYNHIKNLKGGEAESNYNTLYTKIEDCYILSRTATEWKETRDAFIDVQKQLNSVFLLHVQRGELNSRLQQAFETLSKRQTEAKDNFNEASTLQYQALKDKIAALTQEAAAADNFDLMFNNLIITQNKLKETRLIKEQKNELFDDLNIAFTTLKERNKTLTANNAKEAETIVEQAIEKASHEENFKEARVILIDAQNALKELRLSKGAKDNLFTKIRTAFDVLNEKQDAFFKTRRAQQNQNLEQTLLNLTRILAKKEEGIEKLYDIRDGLKYKVTLIKADKNSEALIASFNERLEQLNEKITEAEADITNLKKKVDKLDAEARAIK